MLEIIKQPWPWYVAGPLIGLSIPLLLFLGNKTLGISSSLRHVCAACIPANIPFFQYDWKKEVWNLFFVCGILVGSFLAMNYLGNSNPVDVHPNLISEMEGYGLTNLYGVVPEEIVNWQSLFTLKGFLMIVVGGFLIGFGTRYAGGCTSGHAIMGLSNLQWPSLIATCCFMIGGILMANFLLPFILAL